MTLTCLLIIYNYIKKEF